MFLEYYNLIEQPFGVTPDPRYLFMSPTHRDALAALFQSVTAGRGFMTVVAQPGMGKTTLLFHLLQQLAPSSRTVFLFQNQNTPQDLMRSLLADVGIEPAGSDVARMQAQLNEALIVESRARRHFVVVLDEAQNLDPSVLEMVRMLSNFETTSKKLMQIILAGQPQLADTLASPELVQLRQRISLVARLEPFSPEEIDQYIDHRLHMAGYNFDGPLFTAAARDLIALHSEGIPRNINNLCFNALTVGFAVRQRDIGPEIICRVIEDLNLTGPRWGQSSVRALTAPEIRKALAEKRRKSRIRYKRPALAVAAMLLLLSIWAAGTKSSRAREFIGKFHGAAREVPSKAPAPVPASSPRMSLSNASVSTVPTADLPASIAEPGLSDAARPAIGKSIQVVRHQTLYAISLHHLGRFDGEALREIRQLNPWLTDPNQLAIGQEIVLPFPAKGMTANQKKTAPGSDLVVTADEGKP